MDDFGNYDSGDFLRMYEIPFKTLLRLPANSRDKDWANEVNRLTSDLMTHRFGGYSPEVIRGQVVPLLQQVRQELAVVTTQYDKAMRDRIAIFKESAEGRRDTLERLCPAPKGNLTTEQAAEMGMTLDFVAVLCR